MAVQSDKLRLLRRIPQIRFEEELRGYSKSQVDRVLENLAPLADEIEVLQQRLAEAEQRAANIEAGADHSGAAAAPAPDLKPPEDFDEQLREVMLMAQRTAKDRVEKAEADAEEIRSESKANADSLMASARTEAKELKGEAHAQREQMLADAEEERAQMLETARTETEERRAAVEAQLVESEGALRDDLLEEIKDLRTKREELAEDLALFEEHLGSRRAAVQAALAEISEAIDDPEKLRENEPLALVEVPEVDEDGLREISVESDALDELAAEAESARTTVDGPGVDAEPEFEAGAPEYEQEAAIPVEDHHQGAAGEWNPSPIFEESEPLGESLVGEAQSPPDPTFESQSGSELGVAEAYQPAEESYQPPAEAYQAPVESYQPPAEAYQAPAEAYQAPAEAYQAPEEAYRAPEASDFGPDDSVQPDPAERPGFFDSTPPTTGEPRGWDAPPSMPEPVAEELPQETPTRGGLLSGLLGGRRSNDPTPPPEPAEATPGEGGYLPPPTGDMTPGPDTSGEGMLGLRRRMAAAPPEADFDPGTATEESLTESAIGAITEPPPPPTADSGFGAAPEHFNPEPDFSAPPTTRGASPFDSPAPSEDLARPAWVDAIPDDVESHLGPDDLGGGASDQYLEELRRVTGEDAVTDENDEALNRFLNDPEDQGGGWFGRRK